MTPAEAALWKHLKDSHLGKKFRRQHSVGPYILDFFCPESRVAVELDGQCHKSELRDDRDVIRDRYLGRQDIRVLRFENRTVFKNLEGVLEVIKAAINEPTERSE